MSIINTMSGFVQATFIQATDLVNSSGKAVGMLTTYVDNAAEAQSHTVKANSIASAAKELDRIYAELDASESLVSIYADLEAEWKA